MPDPTTTLECLDAGRDDHRCRGPVELRMPLSGTGQPFPRCDAAWEERLDEQDRINRLYAPDADVAPAWIDPAAAGERWDDDY